MSDLKDRLRHWIDPRIFNVSKECAADISAALQHIEELEAWKAVAESLLRKLHSENVVALIERNENGEITDNE